MTDVCKCCGAVAKRSNAQNKLYWSLLHEIADKLHPAKETYSAETWHIYFKARYLGSVDLRLPNGKVFTQPKTTVDLDKAEMNDYITKVEKFAAEHGVYSHD